jgi:hypothetical protein
MMDFNVHNYFKESSTRKTTIWVVVVVYVLVSRKYQFFIASSDVTGKMYGYSNFLFIQETSFVYGNVKV